MTIGIAFDPGLGVRTIEVHCERAIRRLGLLTMVEAIRLLTLALPSVPLMDVRHAAPGRTRNFEPENRPRAYVRLASKFRFRRIWSFFPELRKLNLDARRPGHSV